MLEAEPNAQPEHTAKVLAALRDMRETDLHKTVIHPLLEAIGGTNIEYVHGPSERGKDFIYILMSPYGDMQLCVCQVKNEKLTGNSTSSKAATTVLHQLLQCHKVQVLNPLTNTKQLPQQVVLFTTYNLPDVALADTQALLTEVTTTCTIVGPDRIVSLLYTKLRHIYDAYAIPGEGIQRALRRFVGVHHEAPAFEIRADRELSQFFVNLGIALTGTHLARLARKTAGRQIRPETVESTTSIDPAVRDSLESLYDTLPERFPRPFFRHSTSMPTHAVSAMDAQHSAGADVDSDDGIVHDEYLRRISVSLVSVYRPQLLPTLNALSHYLGESSPQALIESVNLFYKCDTLVWYLMKEVLGDYYSGIDPLTWKGILSFRLREVDPAALLDCRSHLCVTGEAGAGKTCFSRRIVQNALERGIKCIYFPAARITGTKTLVDDIRDFLSSLSESATKAEIDDLFKRVELIVIDGCDEAVTFGEKLGREIIRLCVAEELSVSVKHSITHYPWIPKALEESVIFYKLKKAFVLISPISEIDFDVLIGGNRNTIYEAPLVELRNKARIGRLQVIVTSRTRKGLKLPPCFRTLSMSSFDDEQLASFFRKWFVGKGQHAEYCIEFVTKNTHVREICRVPMIATLVAALYENGYDLPRTRTEVYSKRFELLLSRWDRTRHVPRRTTIIPEDKMLLLSRIALWLHERGKRQFSVQLVERVWETGLHIAYPGITAEIALDELQHVDNVVYEDSRGEFSLGHLSYQEFLAAHAIVHGQKYQILADKFGHPWWRLVLVFFAGISRDIAKLLKAIQEHGSMHDATNLLDDMFAEAGHSDSELERVFWQMKGDSLLGDGGDIEESVDDDDEESASDYETELDELEEDI